ncbi:MAG: sulfite exporter TauE/SafE family protein [Chloroflexota bacterium]
MLEVWLAFLTGLTTGGLSCLAVQGGLLASSLANQIESDLRGSIQAASKRKKVTIPPVQQPRAAAPIAVFLAAKLLAYTALGFLLGLAGQSFQLSPMARAVFQVLIGVFMIGSALRMLNVHPVFRIFAFEPPAFVRRRLRRVAASGSASLATPAILGALTVLIPCGITQAMMAAALSTGNPLTGAVLMFAFTLGTSPVFFAVAYFATRLGARLERHFMRFAALVVLLLGLFAVDTGITLAGSPISLTRLVNNAFPQTAAAGDSAVLELQPYQPFSQQSEPEVDPYANDDGVITVQVFNYGYEPNIIHAKAGVPLRMRLVSNGVYSCSLAFVIPSLGVQEMLEPTGELWIDIPAQKQGARLPFSCSMGMYTGVVVFDS